MIEKVMYSRVRRWDQTDEPAAYLSCTPSALQCLGGHLVLVLGQRTSPMPGPPKNRISSLEEPPLSEIGMTKLMEQKFWSIMCSNKGTKLLAALPPLKTTTLLLATDICAGTLPAMESQIGKLVSKERMGTDAVDSARIAKGKR